MGKLVSHLSGLPLAVATENIVQAQQKHLISFHLTSHQCTLVSNKCLLIVASSKHARQVLSIQWNRALPNLLAAGFEKTRQECGVAIWDVTTGSKFVNGLHTDNTRPVTELGVTETAQSVAWVQTKSILAGMNGKHIKLFDLRGESLKL